MEYQVRPGSVKRGMRFLWIGFGGVRGGGVGHETLECYVGLSSV